MAASMLRSAVNRTQHCYHHAFAAANLTQGGFYIPLSRSRSCILPLVPFIKSVAQPSLRTLHSTPLRPPILQSLAIRRNDASSVVIKPLTQPSSAFSSIVSSAPSSSSDSGPSSPSPSSSSSSASSSSPPMTVVIFGFLGCQPRHMSKYAALHEKQGRHVIPIIPSPLAPFIPQFFRKERIRLLKQLLKLVKEGPERIIVFHLLSNNGAYHFAALVAMLRGEDREIADGGNSLSSDPASSDTHPPRSYSVLSPTDSLYLERRIRGIIFDSAPSPLTPRILSRGYLGFLTGHFTHHPTYHHPRWSPWIERLMSWLTHRPFFAWQQSLMSRALNLRLPPAAHLLYIYSYEDQLIPHEDVEQHAKSQASDLLTFYPLDEGVPVIPDEKPLSKPERKDGEMDEAYSQRVASMKQNHLVVQSIMREVDAQSGDIVRDPSLSSPKDMCQCGLALLPHQDKGTAATSASSNSPSPSHPPPLSINLLHPDYSLLDSHCLILRAVLLARFHGSAHVEHLRRHRTQYENLVQRWMDQYVHQRAIICRCAR